MVATELDEIKKAVGNLSIEPERRRNIKKDENEEEEKKKDSKVGK